MYLFMFLILDLSLLLLDVEFMFCFFVLFLWIVFLCGLVFFCKLSFFLVLFFLLFKFLLFLLMFLVFKNFCMSSDCFEFFNLDVKGVIVKMLIFLSFVVLFMVFLFLMGKLVEFVLFKEVFMMVYVIMLVGSCFCKEDLWSVGSIYCWKFKSVSLFGMIS